MLNFRKMTGSRWLVAAASTPGGEGPEYIALEIDQRLLDEIAWCMVALSAPGKPGAYSYSRITHFGSANILLLDLSCSEVAELVAVSEAVDLSENRVVLLPEDADLEAFVTLADKRGVDLGGWRSETQGITVFDGERNNAVYAFCRVKHTDLVVESRENVVHVLLQELSPP